MHNEYKKTEMQYFESALLYPATLVIVLFSVSFFLNVLVRSELTPEEHDPECTIQDEYEFDFTYCSETLANEYHCTLTKKQQDWLVSLWQEALQDRSSPPRRRREIRVLSEIERANYFNAVNELKADKVCLLQSYLREYPKYLQTIESV